MLGFVPIFRMLAWAILAILVIRFIFEYLLPKLFYRLKNKIRFSKGVKWRSDRELLYWLQRLKPDEFELYIAELFKKLGYSAEHVGSPNDHGIDVIAKKDGVKHYIQCKNTPRVT
ncbi:MAG: restriction endonuclease [Candidatus Jorgensenbacteria bacterium]